MIKSASYFRNAKTTNIIIALIGIVLILFSIILGLSKTISIILVSIGTSILASSIVSSLNARYLLEQSNTDQMVRHWGISGIYAARSEINVETNELLKSSKNLEICAMGLKGFRDAQGYVVERRISDGMHIKILTIDPNSPFLAEIDKTEGLVKGSTKSTIISLIDWAESLKRKEIHKNQVVLKTYDHYPYDFYFCIDGTVFTGPYQKKTSQQTITYKYSAYSFGAQTYSEYFDSLWEMADER